MTKKAVLALLAVVCSQANHANAFDLNVPSIEFYQSLERLDLGDLSVGETGLVSLYSLRACEENNSLMVNSLIELETDISEYSNYLEISRLPNNEINIKPSQKGKLFDQDSYETLMLDITFNPECSEFRQLEIPLLAVNSIDGKTSLRELLQGGAAIDDELRKAPENDRRNQEETLRARELQVDRARKARLARESKEWQISESKSPIDDSPTVTISRDSKLFKRGIILRCIENKTEVYILTDDYLSNENLSVLMRFDKEDAQRSKISISTDRTAIFLSRPISKIRRMLSSEKMTIRYKSYNGSESTLTYNLEGLSEHISKLQKACNWK